MKLSINRDQLLNPLQRVIGAVERNGTMPTLSCVLVQCSGGQIHMTATNLEIQLHAHIDLGDSASAHEFATLVPARKLFDIVRALPLGSELDMSFGSERLTITCNRSRFTFGLLPAESFPAFDTGTVDATYRIDPAFLKFALKRCAFAMATKDVRFYLNGARMLFDRDTLSVTASDGHRLAIQPVTLHETAASSYQIIMPRASVHELIKLLPDESQPEPCAVSLNDRTVTVELPGLTFSSKVIAGKYPDIERVIPRTFSAEFVVSRPLIMDVIRRVDILSNEHNTLEVELEGGQLQFTATNVENDAAADAIQVDCSDSMRTGFNAAYLLDALGNIETDNVLVQLNNEIGSVIRHPGESSEGLYVVMPRKL